jgi:hypothetical protein
LWRFLYDFLNLRGRGVLRPTELNFVALSYKNEFLFEKFVRRGRREAAIDGVPNWSFINDVHQKMGFIDPSPPLVTKFSNKKLFLYEKITKLRVLGV